MWMYVCICVYMCVYIYIYNTGHPSGDLHTSPAHNPHIVQHTNAHNHQLAQCNTKNAQE